MNTPQPPRHQTPRPGQQPRVYTSAPRPGQPPTSELEWASKTVPLRPVSPPPVSTPPEQPKRRRRVLVWLVSALGALVVIGAAAGVVAWQLGYLTVGPAPVAAPVPDPVLDVRQVEAGAERILSDPINGYGANKVTNIVCNRGVNPTVVPGDSFTCEVTLNGAQRHVQILIRDAAGTYEVDGPR